MKVTTELPDWFIAEQLKLKNYYRYRYTSFVEDEFFRVRNYNSSDLAEYAQQLAAFNALMIKSKSLYIDIGEPGKPDVRTGQWDNKIVLEVETPKGETYFIGYYDWHYTIGRGRRGDSWVTPYPYVIPDVPKWEMFDKATIYAFKCHNDTKHRYDGHPYSYHLNMVDEVIMEFIDLIPHADQDDVRAGGRCHDVIEDCRQTFNDVKKATNERVAELAYALTNEKGRNRAERANDKYYENIRNTPYAVFLKCADRIANIKHGVNSKSPMVKAYKAEHTNFLEKLFPNNFLATGGFNTFKYGKLATRMSQLLLLQE